MGRFTYTLFLPSPLHDLTASHHDKNEAFSLVFKFNSNLEVKMATLQLIAVEDRKEKEKSMGSGERERERKVGGRATETGREGKGL